MTAAASPLDDVALWQIAELERVIRTAWTPPPSGPMWQWWEENISLDNTSPAAGKYSTELVPMVRIWADHAQNPLTRRFVSMLSAQSTKTQNLINKVLYRAVARPCTTMWAMASKDSVDEFRKKRLERAIEECEATAGMLSPFRQGRNKSIIQLDAMNILLRGSNSRIGLQSDPVGLLICDERREWKKGAIQLVRKRLRTFANALEISVGTAGVENDDLHLDWKDGSQGFIHWRCPQCNHSQPFRFGRKKSPFWPDARTAGGVVWSEDAKKDGAWDRELVEKSARYECEHCKERFENHQKLMLLKSIHEVHRHPERLPALPSIHWNALYMPWASCSFGVAAWELLQAKEKLKFGNVEAMKAFVTETLGEPWREEGESVKPEEILQRCDPSYKMGECWPDNGQVERLLVIDLQQGFWVAVDRQWRYGGPSRLIRPMREFSFDDARAYQLENGIKDCGVFIDSAYNTTAVKEACVKYGWNLMLGDEHEEFSMVIHNQDDGKSQVIKVPWKMDLIDPFHGTSLAGRQQIKRFTWSKPHYRAKLFEHYMRGTASSWGLPSDIADYDAKEDKEWRYLWQMGNVERVPIVNENGVVIGSEYKEKGRHDFPDCELMQLAAADASMLTRPVGT